MTKEENDKLETLLKKDPSLGRRRLSALSGVSENRVQLWLKKRGTGKLVVEASPVAKKGMSVKDFLGKLDYPAILAKAIKVHCKDAFLQETDMRAVSGLNPTTFRQAVNTGTFTENMIKVDGVVWWGTAANIAEAKKTKGVV